MSQLSPSPLDRILELKDEAEKLKVELPPELKAYILTHLEIVQEKIRDGVPVLASDLDFIDIVRAKVKLFIEIQGRDISLQQWQDLLYLARTVTRTYRIEAGKTPKEWIDANFLFPGEGRILVPQYLDLRGIKSMTHLPANLEVNGNLNLENCSSLVRIPENLQVNGDLVMSHCISLVDFPKNFRVKKDLILEGCGNLTSFTSDSLDVGDSFILAGCKALTNLPENLKVGRNLHVGGCTSLKCLPENLEVGFTLYLSPNLPLKVREDAKRLKKEGKIKGEIKYL